MGRMSPASLTTDALTRTLGELRELLKALDRRVPQVERAGEISIAQAANGLRAEALRRIEELERERETRYHGAR